MGHKQQAGGPDPMSSVFFYVQHLLGIGHLRRAAIIARALRRRGIDVDFVSGGAPSEAGEMDPEMFAAMDKFNDELINAGILLDGTGLTPTSRGARVRFSGSNRTVTVGPFPETTEIIAGFMIWKVASLQEAIDWVKRFPTMTTEDSDVEIRPLMEPEDFAGVISPERLEEVKELEASSADRDGSGLARFK